MRVLLAEDERELNRALVAILEHESYTVDAAFDGEEALWFIGENDYDVIVCDIMMPKLDGLSVLRRLRADGNATPVLLLTAKSQIADRVEGLDAGANDYLTKPFAAKELLARLRALTRSYAAGAVRKSSFADISLDAQNSRLSCEGESVDLTARECQMMEMLIAEPGDKVSTEQFMRKVWGSMADVETNVVWVNLSNLRKKLAQIGSRVSISSLRGVGYYLEDGGEDA